MHSTNNNLLVIGYDEVYRSTTGGAMWDSISFNVSNGQALRSIALAPSDENYIYAASYSKIKVTKDAGQTDIYKPGLANTTLQMLRYQAMMQKERGLPFRITTTYIRFMKQMMLETLG